MASKTYGKSRISSGVLDVLFVPRGAVPGRRLVVLCHGMNGDSRTWADGDGASYGNTPTFAAALSRYGFTLAALDFSNSWGTPNATTLVDAARAYGAANLGTAADKINLIGFSMGNLTSLGYVRDHPTRVGGAVGIAPVSDLNDVFVNNRASAQASIAAMWANGRTDAATVTSGSSTVQDASIVAGDAGKLVATSAAIPAATYVSSVIAGTSFVLSSSPTTSVPVNAAATAASVTLYPALPTTSNPTANATALSAAMIANGVTWQAFYSTADPTIIASTVTHLASLLGASATLNSMGAIGTHGDVDLGDPGALAHVDQIAALLTSWGS